MAAEKIVVAQVLPELDSGGVERDTIELAEYLVQQGHKSLVISGGGRMVAQLEAKGSEHIKMPLGQKSPTSLGCIWPLRRLLLKRRVDILHLRSRMPAWIAYLAWRSLPCRHRPKLITTFHGFYSVNRYSAIMTRGEKVIAVSQSIVDHIREQYQTPAERIELIHDGVNTKLFDPAAVTPKRTATLRSQWQLPSDGPIIMLPARISKWKGHDIFLQSLAHLKGLPWFAVCVGGLEENPGYVRQLYHLTEEMGLTDRVKFVGHCKDMPAALLLADLVVSPASTQAEAFGLVAVEAAAMGKPVVASAHGGSKETVLPGQTGWLVEPGNVPSLATVLRDAISDSARLKHFGSAGRNWVRAHFAAEKMCAKTLEIYRSLLSAKQ